LDDDDAGLVPALAERGVVARPAVWDDPTVDWSAFELTVLRSTWDFPHRREEFLTWARSVPRLVNSPGAVRWNTDKHYLADLAQQGIPVVPTDWLEPADAPSSRKLHTRFPTMGDFVIKPAVSAGSADSGRYNAASARARGLAIQHARRLLDAGRTVMLQRYVTSIDEVGETGLVFLDGQFAWAVARDAMLAGPDTGTGGIYRRATVHATQATDEQIETGRRALAAAARVIGSPPGVPLLQARVDVVAAATGSEVLEVELAHPTLFLACEPSRVARVADAIAARVRPRRVRGR
jgi:hypothetical protein